jgi:hypothetical protein
LKLNGTYQLLVYGDGVNILEGSLHTVKENAEALVVASKETGINVNVDKTKYMVMSRDQNTGRSHIMKIGNSSFERGGRVQILENNLNESKLYLGRNQEQSEVRECLLSFGAESLLSKNLKIKIH